MADKRKKEAERKEKKGRVRIYTGNEIKREERKKLQ